MIYNILSQKLRKSQHVHFEDKVLDKICWRGKVPSNASLLYYVIYHFLNVDILAVSNFPDISFGSNLILKWDIFKNGPW